MAPRKKAKQAKSNSSPVSADIPIQSTATTSTPIATAAATSPDSTSTPASESASPASDSATASEPEPTSASAFESAPATKPSKKSSKKDAPDVAASSSTTTNVTMTATTTEETTPAQKRPISGRKRASPVRKWDIRDTHPVDNSSDGDEASTSSEAATSTAMTLNPNSIRGWNHATPETMAAAQSSSSGNKSKNNRQKSTTPPTLPASTVMVATTTNQPAATTNTVTATTSRTTNNSMSTAFSTNIGNIGNIGNNASIDFDPDATETDPDLTESDRDHSESDYVPGNGQNQSSGPRHPRRPHPPVCQQQAQVQSISNNYNNSNNFGHDVIGMVENIHPPNVNAIAGGVNASLRPTLYSFPPHVWSSRAENNASKKRGPNGEELIYPRMGTFSPTLCPTSDFSPLSDTSVPSLPLPLSSSSQPASKKPRTNTRTNTITDTATTTVPSTTFSTGRFPDRDAATFSATPNNGGGRGERVPAAAATGTARQTAPSRATGATNKTSRRYWTGLAGAIAAQSNGYTIAATFSNNSAGIGHADNGNGDSSGNGDAMDVDCGNHDDRNDDSNDDRNGNDSRDNTTYNSTNRDSSNNIVRSGNNLIRRVGNQPIIAHSHIPQPGTTPAEIGAAVALTLIRLREEAWQRKVEEEQRKERRRSMEEMRRRFALTTQQRGSSVTPSGQQTSFSPAPLSSSTQYALISIQNTPLPHQIPQQYPGNQNQHGQSFAASGSASQAPHFQVSQYHAPNYQPGNHAQNTQHLQHQQHQQYQRHSQHSQHSQWQQHYQSSQSYQPSQYRQHPQHIQYPVSQYHHQQLNVHQSSFHHGSNQPHVASPHSPHNYYNHNGNHFNGNYFNGNHHNYNQQYDHYSNRNQYYNNNHYNDNQEYSNYNNYNNTASFSTSAPAGSHPPPPSPPPPPPPQPHPSSRPSQGYHSHGSYTHLSPRRYTPFPPQLPDSRLTNVYSNRYSTSTSNNTRYRILTSPAPQPPASARVSQNPGGLTQHQFPEWDRMTRASQAEFATLPPIMALAVQGLQTQQNDHVPTPSPASVPSSHPSSGAVQVPHLLQPQHQQQQRSESDYQSEKDEDNDADDEF
ncbi:hypothetical protein BG015_002796 [Linnemannia schmuckeri]|uniref:Uncharacterized protein n=1 Tax=Linnemannia schmuckeri TaxID=64567 RepID=A0A9P5S5I3_9FUNG|nr:hypothetical protein BG015_002796 [Linnemannia schmuckeri]